MAKVLKIAFPKKCIGCELCVMEVQRQLGKVGLEGSLIRIFRDIKNFSGIAFSVDLDPTVTKLEIEKIAGICPVTVFTVEEQGLKGDNDFTN